MYQSISISDEKHQSDNITLYDYTSKERSKKGEGAEET